MFKKADGFRNQDFTETGRETDDGTVGKLLSVSIVSSGAFLVDVCCCPGHIRGRRRSPSEASWCQFRKQVWGTKGIEQSQVVEGWPRMRKTIRSCGCGCGRDRLRRRGWRRGRWVRAFGVGDGPMVNGGSCAIWGRGRGWLEHVDEAEPIGGVCVSTGYTSRAQGGAGTATAVDRVASVGLGHRTVILWPTTIYMLYIYTHVGPKKPPPPIAPASCAPVPPSPQIRSQIDGSVFNPLQYASPTSLQ
jgi:hypothetical protein